MSKGGDFTPILNVLSALKQEDEDLYDICLHYPNEYSPQEIKENLRTQGHTVGEQVDLDEVLERVEEEDVQVDVHTNSLEEPIISHGESDHVINVLQEGDEHYQIEGEEKKIKPPKHRVKLTVHTNPDVKVFWKLQGELNLGSCLMDCEVFDNWNERLEELRTFLEKEKKRPSQIKKSEKKLGTWLCNQLKNYKDKKGKFKNNLEQCKLWNEFIEKHKEYFNTSDELWFNNLQLLKQFLDKYKKRPTEQTNKILWSWVINQTGNYKTNKDGFRNKERCKLWEEFMEEYKEYFNTSDELWFNKLQLLKQFLDKYKKRPTRITENTLHNWVSDQLKMYNSKKGWVNDNSERCRQWEEFIREYGEYIKPFDKKWDDSFEELKQFLIKEQRRPSQINELEKKIGCWFNQQHIAYTNKKRSFTNKKRCEQWEKFINDYGKYLKIVNNEWFNNLQLLKQFLDKYKKKPEQRKEKIGKWLQHQTGNYKTKSDGFKDNPERCKLWEEFLEEYKEYLTPKKPKKKFILIPFVEPVESSEQKRLRVKSELSVLHQKYKTMRSDKLAQHLIDNPTAWQDYHRISESNEESFPSESIPRNQIICELEKIKTKRQRPKQVVDLGCGKALIAKHFQDKGDTRFQFTNIDHVANDASVQVGDISKLPFENDSVEICILSLAMWGSNCKDYIQEVHRVLETNGILYIIEPTKRWTDLETEPAGRLREWLKDFHIRQETIEKFTFFVAMK
jgi:hypothetical protein